MNLYLFDEETIVTFSLPNKKIGNFWMVDNNGDNVINIKSENKEWVLSGNDNSKIITVKNEEKIILKKNQFYVVEKNNKRYVLLANKMNDISFSCYDVKEGQSIKIGKNADNDISIGIPYFLDLHFTLFFENNKWRIQRTSNASVYLNDEIIKDEVIYAKNGDAINVYGVKIILTSGYLFVNNLLNTVKVAPTLEKKEIRITDEITNEEIKNEPYYSDKDYFLRSPRMRKFVKTFELNIDSPPQKEKQQNIPIIMTLAPMITMAASSLITLANTLEQVGSGNRTWRQALPALVITTGMVFTMLVWPFVTRWYEKKQRLKRETERQDKYRQYLGLKRRDIIQEFDNQRKIIEENLLPIEICNEWILNKRRTLWERKIDQGDFLTVRIGKGQKNFDANIRYSKEDFTMDDDDLKNMLIKLIDDFSILKDIPISYSFAENNLTAINGIYPKYIDFLNNMILQMMAYHGYDILKIVVFTNKKNQKKWNYLKESPYCFSDDKMIRFFATNTEEMQEISNYLEQIFVNRQNLSKSGNDNERVSSYMGFNSYFLIIIDDIDSSRKINIVDEVLESKNNVGFSLIVLEERLSKIPSQIYNFITIGDSTSAITNIENSNQIRFNDEVNRNYDMNLITKTLANVPIVIENNIKNFPNVITFLELFGVGQIEQLNVLNRWKNNNPIKSLKAEIGVNENNDLFVLDIHEKMHGPHGLVAGMTGSGKSEFIITYVLSMAVNYSPEEVAFVLIDYKGGGLAGAFVNSETGEKLPHVVGTVTNLDKSEINRSLSSIQSELRSRQEKFNEVRDKVGESTIDIYKYQKLYREGVINEPIPHLIIVCDEFAELKDQQPDFMDDLVSTARIGRSLGVHLILATQKPSGVVDSQIWSNSKFKICLKVQDREDSMEMIQNDLAAKLKNVGRFYLQVGYNEFFALGQAAWAGAQYYPAKEFKKVVDKNLYFIDNVGSINRTINNSFSKRVAKSEGEELTNIVKYLIDIGKETNLNIKPLWLDKLPDKIYLDNLYKKYNYVEEKYDINPIIGEYDNPTLQSQGLLTLPLTSGGNAIFYGMSESGKDEVLQSLAFSIITHHTSDEVNLYLIDYGSEGLINFIDAPQVGDVILGDDEEKLKNLLKMLNNELNDRKKMFTKFGGNYKDYLKLSGKTIPNIVVFINSIEVMNELYMDMLDNFVPLIREGAKYGITFVITTESMNTVKMKVVQSCKQIFTLQLNNEAAYKDILGRTEGVVPSPYLGRGLVKLDKVVEFQSALIADVDDTLQKINDTITALNEKSMTKAKVVPIMQDIIKLDMFKNSDSLSSIPVGIAKDSLVPISYDFKKNPINLISSNEIGNIGPYLNNILNIIQNNNTYNRVVIDAINFFDNFDFDIPYVIENFEKEIDNLCLINENLQNILSKNNMNVRSLKNEKDSLCIIVGFEKLYSKISQEYKEKFQKLLQDSVETAKICFIMVDVPPNFKKYEYETWYKNSINLNYGIWIGQGLTQQFLFKTILQQSSMSNIESDYGVVIKNGIPLVVKLINEVK